MNAVGGGQDPEYVVERLVARFPSLTTEHVRRVVEVVGRRMRNGTLRDVVLPVLEEAAMDELRKDADPVRLRDDTRVRVAARRPEEASAARD